MYTGAVSSFLAIIDNCYINKTNPLKATYAFNSNVEGDLRQGLLLAPFFTKLL
jgi:hypothetical protein